MHVVDGMLVAMVDALLSDIGRLIAVSRERAGLSQCELARQAGVHASRLSRWEGGRSAPSLAAATCVLAALGLQARVDVEPLWARVDAEADRLLALSPDERFEEHWDVVVLADCFPRAVPYAVTGAAAARVQGAPISVDVIDLVIEQDDASLYTVARALNTGRNGITSRPLDDYGDTWLTVLDEELLSDRAPLLMRLSATGARWRLHLVAPGQLPQTILCPVPCPGDPSWRRGFVDVDGADGIDGSVPLNQVTPGDRPALVAPKVNVPEAREVNVPVVPLWLLTGLDPAVDRLLQRLHGRRGLGS